MITKENIGKLMDFGGLLVYEVRRFDPTFWKEVIELRTFNEDYARARLNAMKEAGLIVSLRDYLVKFDLPEERSKDSLITSNA